MKKIITQVRPRAEALDAEKFIHDLRNEALREAEAAVFRMRRQQRKHTDTTHRRENVEQSELFE